jgi:hypothetical protein
MEHSTRSQAEASKPAMGWTRPLARPVTLRGGSSLVALADVRIQADAGQSTGPPTGNA